MNCCDENKSNAGNNPKDIEKSNTVNKHDHGHGHKSGMSHAIMMLLCCGAPILLVSLVPLISGVIPGAQGIISKIAPFLCPIMMIFMIPMMVKGHGRQNNDNTVQEVKQIESGRPE